MRRRLVAMPLAVLCLGVVLVRGIGDQSEMTLRRPLSTLPQRVASGWGEDATIDENELRVAGATDYLLRYYSPPEGHSFSVYVGYYSHQLTGRTIHSPKNCLPGAGWQALDARTTTVTSGDDDFDVNRYLLTNGAHRALVYYWYQGRGRLAANEYVVKWHLLRDAVVLGRSEEALVRVVVPLTRAGLAGVDSIGYSVEEGDRIASTAAAELIGHLFEILPPRSGGA